MTVVQTFLQTAVITWRKTFNARTEMAVFIVIFLTAASGKQGSVYGVDDIFLVRNTKFKISILIIHINFGDQPAGAKSRFP